MPFLFDPEPRSRCCAAVLSPNGRPFEESTQREKDLAAMLEENVQRPVPGDRSRRVRESFASFWLAGWVHGFVLVSLKCTISTHIMTYAHIPNRQPDETPMAWAIALDCTGTSRSPAGWFWLLAVQEISTWSADSRL